MIDLAPSSSATIRVDQCLFGYDEGHRLLACSTKLPDDAASLLLPFTDLVPGLSSARFESYWTGLPIASLKAYALMHTWPAPEMVRPGCVWTHVVLIGLSDLARIEALGDLRPLFERPNQPGEYGAYREARTVTVGSSHGKQVPDAGTTLEILRAIYQSRAPGVVAAKDRRGEDAAFSVWSQQWPRMRRSFSFRTAAIATDIASSRVRFDLKISKRKSAGENEVAASEQAPEAWEQVALDDLIAGPTSFRDFLWRYGSDQQRGRERFRFLAEIYTKTRVPLLNNPELRQLLNDVAGALPDSGDGRSLKEELVSTETSDQRMLPRVDLLDLLEYFAEAPGRQAFPLPPASDYDSLVDLWPNQSARILAISETAMQHGSQVSDDVLKHIAAVASPKSFLRSVRDYPSVRDRLAKDNPQLLDSPDLVEISQPQLNRLLDYVHEAHLATAVLGHLISSDDHEAARLLFERFPAECERVVFQRFAAFLSGQGEKIGSAWLEALRAKEPSSLAGRLLKLSKTTTDLAACAIVLKLEIHFGLTAGAASWAKKVVDAIDDTSEEVRLTLFAYLLSLGLADPKKGCEPLFETCFEPVHQAIWNSNLPTDAFETLVHHLPDLYWWHQWDTCLRLRLAVVNAYVDAQLDEASFMRLAKDRSVMKRLIDAASDSKDGRKYLKKIEKI